MAENGEMINYTSQQHHLLIESEHVDRRRSIPKSRATLVLLPRHPTQRHCPIRKSISKRKRCLPSILDSINQPESPNVSGSLCSLSQSSTSSSSCPQSPIPTSSTATKKKKYAVDKCDGRGETALHKAAIKGDVQKVKLLLRKGANPNHQDYAGWTPLHEACIRGWYHVAQALLKAGANANTPGLHNVTALHDATAWSHLSLVKLLLKYGAKLTSKTDKGDTPVEVASAVVLNYLDNHGLIPESGARVEVEEGTYEMRKSTYRSKVVKTDSTDVQFAIKVRCDHKGEDRGTLQRSKKSKKKKSTRITHSKRKMEVDESKKESTATNPPDTKENEETKSSTVEETEATSGTSAPTADNTSEAGSRRSSVSVEDEDEGKRNKRRKEKEEHSRKEDNTRGKEDHPKKEETNVPKKEDHKKDEHILAAKSKSCGTNNASPKSTTSPDGLEGEDGMKSVDSPGPKVPPLKIVLPSSSSSETEQGSRNGKTTARHHPYVVSSNEESSTAASTVTMSPCSPAVQIGPVKEEPQSPSSSSAPNTVLSNEDQRGQQRVLRSTHSSRNGATNSSVNGTTSGSNSSATSGSSSPAAPDLSPQTDPPQVKEESRPVKTEPVTTVKSGIKCNESMTKAKPETPVKVKIEGDDETATKTNAAEVRTTMTYHKEETSTVELHPRKRKLKTKPESTHTEVDHLASFSSAPHPHEVPVTNCYQMFMDIRRQIDVRRKGMFPIQPKPPQGFKDYLMNRCTYTLAGNSVPRLKRRNADPPEGIPEGMRELYQEQEVERYSLRMQHIVEKEKLVLSVEQEILRVHGRAARALANQALPFSACTILKDEEVYNVITPEQEEKDRNARSRYNGRLFISWLQDVDDKWEKIKEEMLARHHKEAESLNAIQKFKWDLNMRQLGLWKKQKFFSVDENFVPMISVSDDFDLLPE